MKATRGSRGSRGLRGSRGSSRLAGSKRSKFLPVAAAALIVFMIAAIASGCGGGSGQPVTTAEATTKAAATTQAETTAQAETTTAEATTTTAEATTTTEVTTKAETTTQAETTTTAEATTEAVAAQEPKIIEMTYCLYFGDASDNPDLKDKFPVEFEKATGYKLVMNILPREDYITKLNLLALSGSLKGIIRGFGNGDIMRFKADGVIDPVDSLKDNAVFKALPDIMQTQCIYDGHVWAVPQSYGGNMFTRHYRKDWLDKLGLAVPETIDDFYTVMHAFTFDDPDGNGVQDTYGFTTRNNWIMQDIYQAFDARLDDTGDHPICYDPKLGYFTDNMPSENMAECLTFLNKCYQEGILDPEAFTNTGAQMREMVNTGRAGSAFYWLNAWETSGKYREVREKDPSAAPTGDLFVQIPALKGKRTEKVNSCGVGGGVPMMLAANTPNGQDMINYFVDAFFGSEQGNLWGRFGIEGLCWKKDNGTVVVLKDENDSPYAGPGLVGSIPAYDFLKIPYVTDGTPEEMKESIDDTTRFNKFIEAAMVNPACYTPPDTTIVSDAWDKLVADIDMAYQECYTSAITGSVPVQQAIETYVQLMRSIGAADVINEVNAYYGYNAPKFEY